MPRKYVPRLGKRTYVNYTEEKLATALKAVQDHELTIRRASVLYNIPFGTLYNKYNQLHTRKIGAPTVLSSAQEKELCEVIKVTGEWGYPLSPSSVKNLVKQFLDASNIKSIFPNNYPGKDWVSSFMKRNSALLATRWSQNIKRARARVCPESINIYFDNLIITLCDVPVGNIINYDETNFTDDPESKRVIVRRGQKHVENVLDHSKSSYSVMFAGSADGTLLPPYVVYGALHLYPTWVDGGPRGTRYNRTKSGWFDAVTFEDWFLTIALPYCKNLENDKPRVLIGDNVASHLSLRVITSCLENNIRFVMLPPNSTHLCQPLDVAYFRPLKKAWKSILEDWKGRNKGCVPKHIFPRLLKKTIEMIERRSRHNMKAGFKAAGIVPLDRNAVLRRIPGWSPEPNADCSFSKQLLILLQEERFGKMNERTIPKKRRIVDIQPGASVCEEQLKKMVVIKNGIKLKDKENIGLIPTIKLELEEPPKKPVKSNGAKTKKEGGKLSKTKKVRI